MKETRGWSKSHWNTGCELVPACYASFPGMQGTAESMSLLALGGIGMWRWSLVGLRFPCPWLLGEHILLASPRHLPPPCLTLSHWTGAHPSTFSAGTHVFRSGAPTQAFEGRVHCLVHDTWTEEGEGNLIWEVSILSVDFSWSDFGRDKPLCWCSAHLPASQLRRCHDCTLSSARAGPWARLHVS